MAETIPFNANGESTGDPSLSDDAKESSRDRVYTNEEVSEIIAVALRSGESPRGDTVNHEEMVAIGRDFGLNPRDIDAAIETIGKTQEVESLAVRARLAFRLHAIAFGVVNLGLFLINMVADPSFWWFLYPLISWGVLLTLHGFIQRYAPALSIQLAGYSKDWVMARTGVQADSGRATFTINDLYANLAEVNGLAQIQDDRLILEFEIADSVFGAVKSKVREISVPLSEIAAVRLDRGMWCTRLKLQGQKLRTFEGVPTAKGGEVTLIFGRQARAASETLARDIAEVIG